MRLLGLRRSLNTPDLTNSEKINIEKNIDLLEEELGLKEDTPPATRTPKKQ